MIKRIRIRVPGNPEPLQKVIVVDQQTTAEDVLKKGDLTGSWLCLSDTDFPLESTELIYDKIDDGAVLFAYR